MCFSFRPKRGIPPRTSRHVRSICCVCARETGSTKFLEWLTLSCTKPSEERQSYALQQSETTVVPGWIHSLMTSKSTSDPRLGTGTRKQFFEPRSKPPKTHCPSSHLPLLYFRLPNFASSISTTTPGPPRTFDSFDNQKIQTSRQKELQSITVGWEIPTSLEIRNCRGYGRINHKQFRWQTCETDRWLLSNHVPLNKLLLKRQRHVRRRRVRALYSTWRRSQRKTNFDRSKRQRSPQLSHHKHSNRTWCKNKNRNSWSMSATTVKKADMVYAHPEHDITLLHEAVNVRTTIDNVKPRANVNTCTRQAADISEPRDTTQVRPDRQLLLAPLHNVCVGVRQVI